MIQNGMSLVPVNVEQRAAMQAIAEVERKRARGGHLAEFPYAYAYFRHLRGVSVSRLKNFGFSRRC
uniref:plasmid SOS inhibition protein A n=1 Tax=Yersinia frederiksenii TaxID=29484 RepID=UPI001F4C4780|nr:plasmid SOS inhibition protein A [Yersinia frederiksenii]